MPFDPDAYLAKSAGGGFDPDAYLATPAAGAASPEDAASRARIEAIKARFQKAQEASGINRVEPGFTDIVKDRFTLGVGRPVSGLAAAVGGSLFGPKDDSTFGERYTAGYESENERIKRAEENTGKAGTAAGFVAGMAGNAPKAVAKSALGLIGQGATQGAIQGAAEHADTAGGAAGGALAGGAVGGAATGVLGGAAKLLPAARRSATAEAAALRGRDPKEMKTEAGDIYKQMDAGGVAYGQPQMATLKQGLDDLVANNQYDPLAHAKIKGYFDKLDKLSTQPQGARLTELNSLLSRLTEEAAGPDKSTRKAAKAVVGEIDKLLQGSAPAVNPNNLDVKTLHPKATELWRQASVAEDIAYKGGKADRLAESKFGVNKDAVTRDAFSKYREKIGKPGAYNPLDQDQRELLARIIKGDKVQNLQAGAGSVLKSLPGRGIAGALTGGPAVLGALLTGNLPGLGAAATAAAGAAGADATGRLLQASAASRGRDKIADLLRNITTGSSARPVYGAATTRSDLAKILAAQAGARAGARGTASYGARRDEEK